MDILLGCRLRLQANLTEQVLPGYGLIFTGKGEPTKKGRPVSQASYPRLAGGFIPPPGRTFLPRRGLLGESCVVPLFAASAAANVCTHSHLPGISSSLAHKKRPPGVTQTARNLGGASYESPFPRVHSLMPGIPRQATTRHGETRLPPGLLLDYGVPVPCLSGLVVSSGR